MVHSPYPSRPAGRKKGSVPAMDFRHEWKHEIDLSDLTALRRRLRAAARPDPHAPGGRYQIRSLYFDTPSDRALREKLDGVNRREKFRIRTYNGDSSLIHLEKKSKLGGLCAKESADLTAEEVRLLIGGHWDWMPQDSRPLLQELYTKMRTQRLRPKTIVDYTREAYVYGPGNIRVTMDYGIRTGLGSTDFLDHGSVTIPVPGSPIILEVKWDAFLPDTIRAAVALEGRRTAPYSKYAACRAYG